MATAFDTFPTYARVALEGQVRDESMADLRTSVALETIPYGRAVFSGNGQMGAVLAVAGGGLFLGISMRFVIASATTLNANNETPAHLSGREFSRVAHGFIWVRTVDGATRGQQAYAVPTTGELTNAAAGNILLPDCYFDNDAAAGELVILSVKGERAIAA